MTSFASESLKLLRRILRGSGGPAPHAGKPRALDGLSAVASVEARICDVAGLGASYPASLGARVWESHRTHAPINAFGAPLASVGADGPRGALSAAIGASLGGQRATVFLSGPDLAHCRDLITQAAGRRAPLVIHAALRATAGHAQALGTGHESYHALADLPCVLFLARTVQQAVDLAVVARRVAELALLPVVVAMDCEQTALALQDVAMPEDALLKEFLGAPAETLPPATRAQRMIFGDVRRRVPRLFDLERPTLLGPLQGPESWPIGAASARIMLDADLERLTRESIDTYAARTGRRCDGLWLHHTKDASIVLIAQGSLAEHAAFIADWMREHERVRVGVVGVSHLTPLDAGGLARALKGVQVACTLERIELSAYRDGPLAQTIRGVLDRALENGRHSEGLHPGLPALGPQEIPRVVTCAAGAGGGPVRAADLAKLVRELASPRGSTYVLGVDFARRTSAFPKHQVLLDAMRRDFNLPPDLGIHAGDADVRPTTRDVTTICIARAAGAPDESFAGEFGMLAQSLTGGHTRSHAALSWHRHEEPCVDRVMLSTRAFFDPGDDAPAQVAVLLNAPAAAGLHGALADDAHIVAPEALAGAARTLLAGGSRRTLFVVPTPQPSDPESIREALLGAALRIASARLLGEAPAPTKAKSRREDSMHALAEPERARAIAAFVAGYEGVHAVDAGPETPGATSEAEVQPPRELLEMARETGGLASPTRFWDHTGSLYRAGALDELVPEPGAGFGAVPALTSLMRRVGGDARILPVFDPGACDGDPALWMTCPDGSVAPVVITPRDLINAGIDLATRAGTQADALRPLVSQLVKRISKFAADDSPPANAGALLLGAFEDVAGKMDTPAERKASMREALDAVLRRIGTLPIAFTDIFFRDPERAAPGAGALLSIVVNPDTCKCPELVLARGGGHGIVAVDRTPSAVRDARELWTLWQDLPDTAGEIIERARKDTRVGTLGAMMLSRHCLHAMAPGDGSEAGSGAKLALRQVLAIAEFHHQPRAQKLLGEIAALQAKLSDRIRTVLAGALPTSDLDALAEGLQTFGRGDVELSALSARIDSAVVSGHVDGELLGGLVDVARGLADLQWKVRSGPMGLGRARSGLTVAAGAVAEWAGTFPCNPFLSPTVIDACGESAGLARGALEACIRDVLAGFRLMRLAKIALERPAEGPHAATRLAGLTYTDLTPAERELVPPMLLVGDGQSLGARGLAQLVWLLDSDLPVKAVVLSDIGGRADGAISLDALGAYPPAQRYDVALLGTLTRRAVVAQSSLAFPEHFFESVALAISTPGPALIHLHAPSPERHGFAATNLVEQAALAVGSRAWPLFTFDPSRPGVFGSCLDISHNPDPTSLWALDTAGAPITPVHWAASERRFAGEFQALEPTAPSPTPVADFLDPARSDRAGRTPTIEIETAGHREKLRVGPALAADALDRTRLWRTLQELSGAVTPFTERVRTEAAEAVAGTHADEISRLKVEHERRIAELRGQFDSDATDRVTSRLLALAGYDEGSGDPQ